MPKEEGQIVRDSSVLVKSKDLNSVTEPYAVGSFPRFWRLFAYILPKRSRDRVFEPAFQELLEDYATARKYRTKWAKRWLTFSFTLHTALMVKNCFGALLADWGLNWIRKLAPAWLLWWWMSR